MPVTPKFTDPPGVRRKANPDSVALEDQAIVVPSPDPGDDLSDIYPDQVVADSPDPVLYTGSLFLIHILEDGFTAAGRVWYRGQELEYLVGDQAFEDTKDRRGVSWVTLDDAAQMQRWGQVMFRRGPWPGETYEDPRAAKAELSRGRKAPALAGIAPRRP